MNRIKIEKRRTIFIAFWQIRYEWVRIGRIATNNYDRLITIGNSKDEIVKDVEDFIASNPVTGGYVFLA